MPPHLTNTSPEDPLIGQIYEGEVTVTHLDNCDLRLANGQRVRLYQHDSLARQDTRLMRDLDQYQPFNKVKFLITHRRLENKGVLYYANERWAINNPWQNLVIQCGDRVQGKIFRNIYNERNQLLGYLLQLDTQLNIDLNLNKSLQPDILIYIPIEELPWEDGSINQIPLNGNAHRLILEKNDVTQVIINEIHLPPYHPKGSLVDCIRYQDEHFWQDANNALSGARIKEKLHEPYLNRLGYAEPILAKTKEEKILNGYHFLIIDDRVDSLQRLQTILEKNGATVDIISVSTYQNFSTIIELICQKISDKVPDLILIDNALPQPNDGLYLTKKLLDQSTCHQSIPPCVLISSYLTNAEVIQIKKSLPRIQGVLLRPITIPQLLSLCHGQTIWTEGTTALYEDKNLSINLRDIQIYYSTLVQQGIVDSIIVITIEQGIPYWESSEGELPFLPIELQRICQESDLRLLINKRLDLIDIKRSDYSDNKLLGNTLQEVCWYEVSLYQDSKTKYIGLGWKSSGHTTIAKILREVIREKYLNQIWYSWTKHNANFINSGLIIHSLVHENRQALNQLQSGMELLEKCIEQENWKTIAKIPDSLKISIQNMTDLTDILLKGQAQRNQNVDISSLLDFIYNMLKHAAQEHKVDFRPFNKLSLHLGIATANISIPLTNIILNAFKHHSRQFARKVSLLMQIKQERNSYWLEFQIRDNGGGVAQHQIKHLFKPGISFASKKLERHGIGLWLSQTIAHQIGGEVELIQNLRGLGACFSLTIPLSLG